MIPSGQGPKRIENERSGMYKNKNNKAIGGGREGGRERGSAQAVSGQSARDRQDTAKKAHA